MFSGLSLNEGSISPVLMPRQMPEKEHVRKSYCFLWHTVMNYENWTQASPSTFGVEGGLVLNLDHFFLSRISHSKKWKWGYVRTPSCHFPNFKEISVWNWNRFGPIFKRKHNKIPMACTVFCIFFEFSSGNGGSTKAVPVSSCRQPVFDINSRRLLYLCSFSPIRVASVVILGTVFPTVFSGLMS